MEQTGGEKCDRETGGMSSSFAGAWPAPAEKEKTGACFPSGKEKRKAGRSG